MECSDLCPYNSDIYFENKGNVPLLPKEMAESIKLIKLLKDNLYLGDISGHRVNVEKTKDSPVDVINQAVANGRKVMGYWYCPMEQESIIVYEIPQPRVLKLAEKLGCNARSIDIECRGVSPLAPEELDRITILDEEEDSDIYQAKYKNQSLLIKHYTIPKFSHSEEKILKTTNRDSTEEYIKLLVEKFRRELCYQSLAGSINLAPKIYAYWICQNDTKNQKGFYIYEDIRPNSLELSEFVMEYWKKNEFLKVYLIILQAILVQNLDLRISHNYLTRLDGSLIRSNIYVIVVKSKGTKGNSVTNLKIKFVDYSKATKCPNDASLVKTFTDRLQIHLGARSNIPGNINLDETGMANYFFEDLVEYHVLILKFISRGFVNKVIKQDSVADKIRGVITSNKLDKLETWITIYKQMMLKNGGIVPNHNDVLQYIANIFSKIKT